MPYTYQQSTGILSGPDGRSFYRGYSGRGDGRCNPAMQNIPMVGPIPQGWYAIGARFECSATLAMGQSCPCCHGVGVHRHGPDVLRLTPDPCNEMFGRAGFLIHGDNADHTASEGCIILSHDVRLAIALNEDKRLEVIA